MIFIYHSRVRRDGKPASYSIVKRKCAVDSTNLSMDKILMTEIILSKILLFFMKRMCDDSSIFSFITVETSENNFIDQRL